MTKQRCDYCGHQMLIELKMSNYWIRWLCPKCNIRKKERLKS